MAFPTNSRRKVIPLPTLTKGTGANTQSVVLPKTGLLAALHLVIRGSVAGTLSNQNALGFSSIIKRVRLTSNSTTDIVDISGAGYHYLLKDMIDSEYVDPVPNSSGRTAITATTFNLDMYIPITINRRDPIGLFLLQNEQTVVTLSVEFELDATVATGATVTCTVNPYMEVFTVPAQPENMPDLSIILQTQETAQAVSAAGEYQYQVPRGGVYLGVGHGLGIGASGSDLFSSFKTRANQSDTWEQYTPEALSMFHAALRGRSRLSGQVIVDYLGTSGLGNYGLVRDVFNSQLVTDFQHVFVATNSGTLYTVRRTMFQLGQG